MQKSLIMTLFLLIGFIYTMSESALARPYNENSNKQDSIEWIAFWDFPNTR